MSKLVLSAVSKRLNFAIYQCILPLAIQMELVLCTFAFAVRATATVSVYDDPRQNRRKSLRRNAASKSRLLALSALALGVLLFLPAQSQASVTTDASVSVDLSAANNSITSPSFSTTTGNELLLAFIASDSMSAPMSITSVNGGGLTWVPVARANSSGGGTSEIWRAFAVTPLSNVTVTASLAQTVFASLQIVSFSGVDTSGTNGSGAIGAVKTAGSIGAPKATLTTTRANSLVFAVGNDYDNAIARTLGSGQTLVHQDLSIPNNDTYWMQQLSSPVTASGTTVTINDTAPTGDHFNLALCEILGPSGTVVPAISGLNKTSGSVGDSIVITGSGFGTSQGSGGVSF